MWIDGKKYGKWGKGDRKGEKKCRCVEERDWKRWDGRDNSEGIRMWKEDKGLRIYDEYW